MCYLTSIIKIKENADALYPLTKLLADEQESNGHGTGYYCFNKADDVSDYGRVEYQEVEDMVKNLRTFDVVNYHFRQATTGAIDETNVHFWRKGTWLFAHNGIINELGDKKKSDSLIFFENLLDKGLIKDNGTIKIKDIKKYTNEVDLGGRFMLINADAKKTYFFGDYHVYLVNQSYMVVSSSSETFESAVYVLGIPFDVETEVETMESDIDGIWIYDVKKGFKQLDDDLKIYNSYYPKEKESKVENKVESKTELVMDANGKLELNSDIYDAEWERLTEDYEKKIEKLQMLGYSDAVIARMDELTDKYNNEIQALEDTYLAEHDEQIAQGGFDLAKA